MPRKIIVSLTLVLAAPLLAHASVLSLQGSGVLLPETAGQQLVLRISGDDSYLSSSLQFIINGGVSPAPAVTHVFGVTGGLMFGPNLFGSVWADTPDFLSGLGSIEAAPNGTTSTSSGLQTLLGFARPTESPTNAEGIYAVLTVTTVGVPAGQYPVTLDQVTLHSGMDPETLEAISVPFELPNIVLTIVPEPSTYALAAVALAGLIATGRCKRRATGARFAPLG